MELMAKGGHSFRSQGIYIALKFHLASAMSSAISFLPLQWSLLKRPRTLLVFYYGLNLFFFFHLHPVQKCDDVYMSTRWCRELVMQLFIIHPR